MSAHSEVMRHLRGSREEAILCRVGVIEDLNEEYRQVEELLAAAYRKLAEHGCGIECEIHGGAKG
jgi:hypothetical protein